MTITTYDDVSLAPTSGKQGGFFKRVLANMVEARSRQARLHVNAYLLGLDDETLASLGYDRKTLERQGASSYFPL
jgi:hypothetical protein